MGELIGIGLIIWLVLYLIGLSEQKQARKSWLAAEQRRRSLQNKSPAPKPAAIAKTSDVTATQADNPAPAIGQSGSSFVGQAAVPNNDKSLRRPRVFLKSDGTPLDADRDNDLWLGIRRQSVTATDARKLVKLNGQISKQRESLLFSKIHDSTDEFFESFALGIQREPIIAAWVKQNFTDYEFEHNRYLHVGENPRHVATPDMYSKQALCEIKVSTKDIKLAKGTYRDQLQWQMHVTGHTKLLLVVENRHTENIEWLWVERNQSRINQLVEAADEFIAELDAHKGSSLLKISVAQVVNNYERIEEPVGFINDESMLTDALLAKLISLYADGWSVVNIASEIDASKPVVVSALSRLIWGLSGELIDNSAPNQNRHWNTEDRQRRDELYISGKSINEIANALGRDRYEISFLILMLHHPEMPNKYLR